MSLGCEPCLAPGSVKREAPVIAILRAGALAGELVARGTTAHVAAVFARSLYLRAGETFLCVGEASIGDGPLTLIADGVIGDLGLRAHQGASISAHAIRIGNAVEFRLDRCKPWHSPGWPAAVPPARLIETSAALASRAAVAAPPEGLARFALSGAVAATPLARVAASPIARFHAWLDAALAQDCAPEVPLHGLIGLGPGLTPSGDDFLCGSLAMLDALAQRRLHAALAAAVAAAAPALTSPLSASLLRAAAAGHVGEHLHDAVAALLAGDVEAAIAAARQIGHSSGWDMLAGAATALRLISEPKIRRDS